MLSEKHWVLFSNVCELMLLKTINKKMRKKIQLNKLSYPLCIFGLNSLFNKNTGICDWQVFIVAHMCPVQLIV